MDQQLICIYCGNPNARMYEEIPEHKGSRYLITAPACDACVWGDIMTIASNLADAKPTDRPVKKRKQ